MCYNVREYATGVIGGYTMEQSIGLKYTPSKDETSWTVSGIGNCSDEEIIIPSEYNGKPITGIDGCAFDSCSQIEHIAISDSVIKIGARAFYACTKLQHVALPSSITSISNSAFEGCTSLKSISIPASVTRICSYAFDYCKALTDVYYEGTDEQWDNITIGNGNDALISANIKFIGGKIKSSAGVEYTFYYNDPDCYVSKIGSCTETDIVIALNALENKKLVTAIDSYAFQNCSHLTSVAIPPSVKTIGYNAFSGCTSLRYVSMPDSVTEIGENAFDNCSSLTSISIPSSVTHIGSDAFYDCSSLIAINVDEKNTEYKSIDGNLYSKDGTTLIQYATGKANTSFTIPTGVTRIGSNAFQGCKNLKSITITSSVTEICNYAFFWCTGLTEIKIPNSVVSIGDSAFYKCTNLKSVTIPSGVTNIKDDVFSHCTSLTSVTIPSSVTNIHWGAFSKCTSLKEILIPSSVINISPSAFEDCESLTSVTFEDVEDWYVTKNGYSTGNRQFVKLPSMNASNLKYLYSKYYWYKATK